MKINFATNGQFYVLNIYPLNIYQDLDFIHRLKKDDIPKIFTEIIKKPTQKYPKKLSFSLNNMKCCILVRGTGTENVMYF